MAAKRASRSQLGSDHQQSGYRLGPIEYVQRDGYLTGRAIVPGRAFGRSMDFTIEIDGTHERISRLAEEARIFRLELIPYRSRARKADQVAQDPQDIQRKYWKAQLRYLHQVVNTADAETLADPDKLWGKRSDAGKQLVMLGSPDLTRDRVIRIVPPDLSATTDLVRLVIDIDPPLAQGENDFWDPAIRSDEVTAETAPTDGGDIDLYLTLNGNPYSNSLGGRGAAEKVGGYSPGATWLLRAHGFTTVTYRQIAEWVLRP